MLHRFLIPNDAGALPLPHQSPQDGPLHAEVSLVGPLARQVALVLRLSVGERVRLFDGRGHEYVARLSSVSKHEVVCILERALSEQSEPAHPVTIHQGLLKADHWEWVLQKGTELGASAFAPLYCDRAVSLSVSAQRLERWRTVVREATEQCGRALVPHVHGPARWRDAAHARGSQPGWVLWEEADATDTLGRSLDILLGAESAPGDSPTRQGYELWLGPEGGLTSREVMEARASGLRCVSLGPRILRAETASIAALSIVLHHLGDLG